MRTTIDLPDHLYRRVKVEAAQQGMKIKELLTDAIEQGLDARNNRSVDPSRKRSELPVIRPATGHPIPSLTNAEIDEIFLQEDIAKILGHE